jgi:hypothetical protein
MDSNVVEGDRLFLIAENLAQDFSRLPTIEAEAYGGMRGLVSRSSIARQLSALDAMDIDHAIARCVVAGNVRRSARMSIKHWLDPDILDFIGCKADTGAHWSTNISVEVDFEREHCSYYCNWLSSVSSRGC